MTPMKQRSYSALHDIYQNFFPFATLPLHIFMHGYFQAYFFFPLFMAHIADNFWSIMTR